MTYMIKTLNLTKSFKEKVAVNNINLLVPKGTIYALLGPNGAGKTTTIRLLLGLLKPDYGKIEINNIDVVSQPKEIRGKIALLPQISAAYHDLTPMQNIKFILELNNIQFDEVKAELNYYLRRLEITADILLKPFSKLSGGEQRAISFIMTIILNKDFLILDEPTSGLDISRGKYVREIILDLAKKGKTIMLSSHIISDLEELAEYCGIMKNGFLTFQDKKEKLIEKYAPNTEDFEEAIIQAFRAPINGE
ncbi:MAG: ABC transporter ATP-binding protein [Candidatus Heimdallarchaeaceae archaeon]